MAELELRKEAVPHRIRIGEETVGVPLRPSGDCPYGIIQMGVDPAMYDRGRLAVELTGHGRRPTQVSIFRQDDMAHDRGAAATLQMELTQQESLKLVRHSVLSMPIGKVILNKLRNGSWVAETEAADILHPDGFNLFTTLIMKGVLSKQDRQQAIRPLGLAPEL